MTHKFTGLCEPYDSVFEFLDNVSATRKCLRNAVQHLDEVIGPVPFICEVFRQQLDIVEKFRDRAVNFLIRLRLCLNNQPLQGSERLGILF